MAQALLSAVGIGLAGLVATVIFGHLGTDISRHVSFGIFSTLVMLLAHSMMMFYLIGKGKAVKDAMAEHHVTGDYYQRIGRRENPCSRSGRSPWPRRWSRRSSARVWTRAYCRPSSTE